MKQGHKIKLARKYRKLTQQQLAKFAGVDQRSISYAERGDLKKNASYLLKIAHALKIIPEWFINANDNRPIEQVDLNKIFIKENSMNYHSMVWVPCLELQEVEAWLKGELVLQKERYVTMVKKNQSEHTFVMTLHDDSMKDSLDCYSLEKGAQIVIDAQAEISPGKFILARCDNKFLFRRLFEEDNKKILIPLNKMYSKTILDEENGDQILGVGIQTFYITDLP